MISKYEKILEAMIIFIFLTFAIFSIGGLIGILIMEFCQ